MGTTRARVPPKWRKSVAEFERPDRDRAQTIEVVAVAPKALPITGV
jgi:hypothetical protein